MEHERIEAAAELQPFDGHRFHPDACPKWLPLVLIANAALYPLIAWLILR